MKEQLVTSIAKLFRQLPHFRGKYSIGCFIQKTILGNSKVRNPSNWVTMKEDFSVLIDLQSQTHLPAMWCGRYDTKLINKFNSNFKNNCTIIDIGANIGYYTLAFAKYGEQNNLNFQIHSFEPLSTNFFSLQKAIEINGFKTINSYKIGLGENDEILGLSITENGNTGNAVFFNEKLQIERNFQITEHIEVKRLDNFSLNKIDKCDFIKIDIEGAEVFFIRGAKIFLTKHKPIIYGEFNSYFMEKFELDLKEAWDFFTEIGYTIYQQNGESKFEIVNNYRKGLCNLLLLPDRLNTNDISAWIN